MFSPIEKLFGIHAQALMLRAGRSALLASNLANADTPGYKARDIDFKAALQSAQERRNQIAAGVTQSHNLHIRPAGGTDLNQAVRYRIPDHPALDANTVDTDREKSAFTENAVRYQISLSMLNRKINGLVKVLRGE